jgi:hypothetical protein
MRSDVFHRTQDTDTERLALSFCRSPNERPSTIKDDSEWESMLMKPGATARPLASTIVGAVARLKLPMAAMRSALIPTSALRGGRPVPS